ncbi:hypothetical protein [Telmatospirillum sp.]|uniref:hypothetical protein n=1 Tax=Telmatospirillum sp. TaxID=2079197 RepID=UPI00283E230E|nr:hypothetical protein [Telmatospirillum sp.]MDR3436396.1 hypothetical protein [Telmatospirillum sp.]
MTKPTSDDIMDWIADSLTRAQSVNIVDKRAIADMILRDLKAKGVRLFFDRTMTKGSEA